MQCTGCKENFDPGINAEAVDGSNEDNVELRVTCPNKICGKRWFTFVECNDLAEFE